MPADLTQWISYAAAAVGGVILCALYAGMETGIYVLNKLRMELAAESGRPGASTIRRQLARPRGLLATLLIGTNLCSYTVTYAISGMFLLAGAGPRAGVYTIIAGTTILSIFGDSVPKNIFRRFAETLVYRLAWLVRVSGFLFNLCGLSPLVRGFSWVLMRLMSRGAKPRDEALAYSGMSAIVAEGHASGALTHYQSLMAERVMHIAEVTLADIMTPLCDAVTAPVDVTRQQVVEIMRAREYRRLPLLDGSGQVTAVLDIYDALADDVVAPPADKAHKPQVLDQAMGVTDALYRMQRERGPMAVVAGSDGRHAGIVTIKDLVEEIVGELEDW